jgi:hypothetical protein
MQFTKIIQQFDRPRIPEDQLASVIREQFNASGVNVPRGGRIAIAVGSRGITNLPHIVKAMVECVKERGGMPFIVPAMGSHGGATAEGQQALLESYGITQAAVGAPIRSSMDVVELPSGDLPNKAYMDKLAYEADGTVVINRVKVHTAFHGPTESGLLKMCVIGLGKHQAALELHRFGVQGLRTLIAPTAGRVLKYGHILAGLAIAENACEDTAFLKVLLPQDFEREEAAMLEWVRAHMPALPVDQLDVLIVEEFGKHISGTGMDVNIIGRMKITGEPEPQSPRITSIVLLDLAEQSHGNANGMGLADVITRRFHDKIDFNATYENGLTHGFLERIKMPVVAETDADALADALKPCHIHNPDQARVLRIKNTLVLDEMWASAAIVEELRAQPQIEVKQDRLVM